MTVAANDNPANLPITFIQGDCQAVMKTLRDNSVDSAVSDSPYGLDIMGKKWDSSVPSVDIWKEVYRVLKPGGHLLAFAATRTYHRLAVNVEDAGFEIRDQIAWLCGNGCPKSLNVGKETGHAEHQGWGTGLKPAMEPIVVARKPLIGTVAANVLKHGTGALNIDGCRIPCDVSQKAGRWPANVIHDGSDEVVAQFPTKKAAGKAKAAVQTAGSMWNIGGKRSSVPGGPAYGDGGSAARFFYSAKASKADRAGSNHPTVKPVSLMRYLCRLVTPPGGTVIDPFAGSGTTGQAAIEEGFNAILIELEDEYAADIRKRFNLPAPVTKRGAA